MILDLLEHIVHNKTFENNKNMQFIYTQFNSE